MNGKETGFCSLKINFIFNGQCRLKSYLRPAYLLYVGGLHTDDWIEGPLVFT